MTPAEFEHALDTHSLWLKLQGKFYRVRRNGRTKTWKKSPERFEIPIKYRFRDCERIINQEFDRGLVDQWFRISEEEPTC